ncbi:hypothetical protein [Streptomyces sp. NPDC056632]|uniref:hypothetical protein n=1 Tax=Streptomyces sp. NPDC056632 TaxID=3345884 RepID=UPI0036A4FB65
MEGNTPGKVRPEEFTGFRARLAKKAAAPPRPVRKQTALAPGSVPEPPDLREAVARMPDADRTWTLLMPYGELLTSNQRLHHMAAYRVQRRLRQEASATARARGLPTLERAAIFYVLHPRPIKRNRDPGNWSVSAKAYVDGLADTRRLPRLRAREHRGRVRRPVVGRGHLPGRHQPGQLPAFGPLGVSQGPPRSPCGGNRDPE